MSRRSLADLNALYRKRYEWHHQTGSEPDVALSPEEAGVLLATSREEGCLTHIVRFVIVMTPGWREPHRAFRYECGASSNEFRAQVVDPAEEMFGCHACIAAREKFGGSTFALIPNTGCEQSGGRRPGPRRSFGLRPSLPASDSP